VPGFGISCCGLEWKEATHSTQTWAYAITDHVILRYPTCPDSHMLATHAPVYQILHMHNREKVLATVARYLHIHYAVIRPYQHTDAVLLYHSRFNMAYTDQLR